MHLIQYITLRELDESSSEYFVCVSWVLYPLVATLASHIYDTNHAFTIDSLFHILSISPSSNQLTPNTIVISLSQTPTPNKQSPTRSSSASDACAVGPRTLRPNTYLACIYIHHTLPHLSKPSLWARAF